jgi:hypothetical protein
MLEHQLREYELLDMMAQEPSRFLLKAREAHEVLRGHVQRTRAQALDEHLANDSLLVLGLALRGGLQEPGGSSPLPRRAEERGTQTASWSHDRAVRRIGRLGGAFIDPESHIIYRAGQTHEFGVQYPDQAWEAPGDTSLQLEIYQIEKTRPSFCTAELSRVIEDANRVHNEIKRYKIVSLGHSEKALAEEEEDLLKSLEAQNTQLYLRRKEQLAEVAQRLP